ncbi:MAG: zf-HC2 domain-containing protein [Acidobacteria bacterium]|nr:zf-HC2 domain-containing protein [Acidobacteriota bacterium]
MKCRVFKKQIEEYLDGALRGKKKARFEEHLSSCGLCRKLLEEREKAGIATGNAVSGQMPTGDDFKRNLHRVEENIMESWEREHSAKPERLGLLSPMLSRLTVAAAVVAVLLANYLLFLNPGEHSHRTNSSTSSDSGRPYVKYTETKYDEQNPDHWSEKILYVQYYNGESGSLYIKVKNDAGNSKGDNR